MRITRQEVLEVWSADQLVLASETSPALRDLPEDARRVACQIGLPSSAEPLYEYEPPSSEPQAGTRYCRIGTDGGTSLLVGTDGVVTSVSPNGEYPIRHVNSSLECFLLFLSKVTAARRRFREMADDDIDTVIDTLYRDLLAVDAGAFADPDTWWSVVFEQMRDGLL